MEELDQWVSLAQRGDQEAFGKAVVALQPRLFPVLFRVVKDEHAATELCQQTWIKVWNKLDTFKGEAAFFTWVYRVGYYTALDWLRKRKREGRVEYLDEMDASQGSDPLADAAGDTGEAPDRALENKEILEQFKDALTHLSDAHRMALELRELDGLSYTEIAEVMDCKVGTVMSRLHHARKQIQEHMEGFRS